MGIDFGLTGIRVATFANEAPIALKPREFASGIKFDVHGEPRPANANNARFFPRRTLGSGIPVNIDGRYFWSEDLCSLVLKDMKQNIEEVYDRLLAKAVITVPASFTHLQRRGLLTAAKSADIQVLSLLNQPTAAGLSCAFFNSLPSGNYLSVSVSETSCECSVIDLQSTLVEVKTVRFDSGLCGEALFQTAGAAFLQHGMSVTGKQCTFTERELIRNVRLLLNELDTQEEVNAQFSENQYLKVTRGEVLRWFEPTLHQYVQFLEGILEQSHLDKKALAGIIVSGGISKFWLVEGILRYFAGTIPLYQTEIADDVCTGAALYAALLVRQAKDWVVWDTVGQGVSVISGETVKQVIAPDSPIPITGHITLAPNELGKLEAKILQSKQASSLDGIVCATIELNDVPPSNDDPTCVDLAVHIRADGILDLSARHKFLDVNLPLKVSTPKIRTDSEYDVGIALKQFASGVYYVSQVEPFSEAEAAGVQLYDVVIAKNNLRIDPLGETGNILKGNSGQVIELTLARGKERLRVSLQCKLSRYSWDKSIFESLVLESVYNDDPRVMITRLLQFGELCAFRMRIPEYALARMNYSRALSVAREKLSKNDSLLIEAIAQMCRMEVLEYDVQAAAGQIEAALANRETIELLCAELLKISGDSKARTRQVASELLQTGATLLRSHVGTQLSRQTVSIFGRSLKIAKLLKLPKDVIQMYQDEYKYATSQLFSQRIHKGQTGSGEQREAESTARNSKFEVGVSLEWLRDDAAWMVSDLDLTVLTSEANIQIYDLIRSVDGHQLALDTHVASLFHGQPGQLKRVEIERRGQRLLVELACSNPVYGWRDEELRRWLSHEEVARNFRRKVAIFLLLARSQAYARKPNVQAAEKNFETAITAGLRNLDSSDPLTTVAIAERCIFRVQSMNRTNQPTQEQLESIRNDRKKLIASIRTHNARHDPVCARYIFSTASAMLNSLHWKELRWSGLHLFSLAELLAKNAEAPAEVQESYHNAYKIACQKRSD